MSVYICPVSQHRLKRAEAGGSTIFYSPYSNGRMLTLTAAKHFLGPDATREIWMRSRGSSKSTKSCPSCRRKMKIFKPVGWIGSWVLDVCHICRIIWFDSGEHPEIPHPEDLAFEGGDSTYIHNFQKAETQVQIQKENLRIKNESYVQETTDLTKIIPSLLGLPVVESENNHPKRRFLTLSFAAFMFVTFITVSSAEVFKDWGYYPGEPFKNFGLNIFTYAFLHAGWMHLIGNMYYFLNFSDDVEEELGDLNFLLFIFYSLIGGTFFSSLFSFYPDSPHVGFSGIISSFMTFYALQFRKAKIGYVFPYLGIFNRGSFGGVINKFAMVRIPAYLSLFTYFFFEVVRYFIYEREGIGHTSHSGHISGALMGVFLYFYFRKKKSVVINIENDLVE